jgi:hypothetical protein
MLIRAASGGLPTVFNRHGYLTIMRVAAPVTTTTVPIDAEAIMTSDLLRERYQPSGRVRIGPFLGWSLAALAVAAGWSVALDFAYREGFYVMVLGPLLAGFVLMLLAMRAVTKGHCRNRGLAICLGLVVGLVCYLGYYHVGLVRSVGLGSIGRLDRLPGYINERVTTATLNGIIVRPRQGLAFQGQVFGVRWLLFAVELAWVCGMPVVAARSWTGCPYSEDGDRWMKTEGGMFVRDAGTALIDALESGTLADWVASHPERASGEGGWSLVTLHHDPMLDQEGRDSPGYLTVQEVVVVQKGWLFLKQSTLNVQTHLKRVRLMQEEVCALLPALSDRTGQTSVASTPPPALYTPEQAAARIESVPAAYAGQLLSAAYERRGRRHQWRTIITFFVGLAMATASCILIILAGCGILPFSLLELALVGCIVSIGLLSFSPFSRRLQQRRERALYQSACDNIGSRPENLVSPDDPDAIFVEVVPRTNWVKATPKYAYASDVGFLSIDLERGLLLFEGDRERYLIPAGAILGCEIEPANGFQRAGDSTWRYLAVVRANHPSGTWEAPLAIRYDARHVFNGKTHRERAEELRERVLAVLDVECPAEGE